MNRQQARIEGLSRSIGVLQGYLDEGGLCDKYEDEKDVEKVEKAITQIISTLIGRYTYLAVSARRRVATPKPS